MVKKIFIQCSNCGHHFELPPALGMCEGLYSNGNRAVGDAFYCDKCVNSWKERNGAEFEDIYENPPKMFVNWWNNKVASVVSDKRKISTYRIVNGVYVEATDEQR